MPQVVMRDAINPNSLTRSIKRLLTFSYAEHFCVQWLIRTLTPHSAKQRTRIWNQRDAPYFPILCARRGIAAHDEFTSVKIHVKIKISPFDLIRLAYPASSKRKTFCEGRAVPRIATMAREHFFNQGVKLVGCRQHDFFTAHWRMLHGSCSVAVNHTGFDCGVQNVSKECDRVVVVSRRRSFGIRARPFFAVHVRDLADFCFIQSWPAFDERGKALSPIVARPRLNPQIVVEIPQMNDGGFAECHLRRHFAVAIADALPMLFEKFSKFGLRHAEV